MINMSFLYRLIISDLFNNKKIYVLGISFVDLLIFEVHLLDRFRWFMENPNEKQMVEDSAHVARPMQEKFEENLRHEV